MRDSCGTGGQVRHLRVKRINVAHRLPRGKRAPGTEINHFQLQQCIRKQHCLLQSFNCHFCYLKECFTCILVGYAHFILFF
ncbi:hypothetical protein [Fictibacillus sp. UD]|uniref:hypothetical protein n=1 Tax=Fictibacillus sp. UD TaxID=3038777 RepID=UPI00374A52DD